ncbi:MAG: RluA family pseudouridine synthase [Nitrospirae bacterium]|nr:RluA family pseudouridine synthase [Nitrospirota bacterium]
MESTFTRNLTVEDSEKGVRLDQFLSEKFGMTRSQADKSIREARVLVNRLITKQGYRVKPGDSIELTLHQPDMDVLIPEELPIGVVYEDAHLVVADKPPGMVMYPAAGHDRGTLMNALAGRHTRLATVGAPLRPGVVHRIDKDTSGLVVVALDDETYYGLLSQFRNRTIKRKYLVLILGRPVAPRGELTLPIGRSTADRKKMSTRSRRSKPAVTRWILLEDYSVASLIEATLGTGRTHQIRVHWAAAGHPVLGDDTYGRQCTLELDTGRVNIDRQMLHAALLGFTHPITGQVLEFKSPLPTDMAGVMALLRAHASAASR